MSNKSKKHRSFSWKLLRTLKRVFNATKYQEDTAITIPPFFKDAGRGKERICEEETATPQPTVTSWAGLNDKEKAELIQLSPQQTTGSSAPIHEGLVTNTSPPSENHKG